VITLLLAETLCATVGHEVQGRHDMIFWPAAGAVHHPHAA
jgi:hypothetical protein